MEFSSKMATEMCIYKRSNYIYQKENQMPLLNGPIMTFIRKHRLVRRTVFAGGIVVGIYFAGVGLGWWSNFLV